MTTFLLAATGLRAGMYWAGICNIYCVGHGTAMGHTAWTVATKPQRKDFAGAGANAGAAAEPPGDETGGVLIRTVVEANCCSC